jgi:hypothetical protein
MPENAAGTTDCDCAASFMYCHGHPDKTKVQAMTIDTKTLIEQLEKTALILRVQADLARRIAETYAPERDKWEDAKGDDRLTAMIRYQLDQEAVARSLTKDAAEAEEAAQAIRDLTAEVARLKALGDGLAGYTQHRWPCIKGHPLGGVPDSECTCGLSVALAAWEKKDA